MQNLQINAQQDMLDFPPVCITFDSLHTSVCFTLFPTFQVLLQHSYQAEHLDCTSVFGELDEGPGAERRLQQKEAQHIPPGVQIQASGETFLTLMFAATNLCRNHHRCNFIFLSF
jgi:hypothetical protein